MKDLNKVVNVNPSRADSKLLRQTENPARRAFLAKNCVKLAKVIENLPEASFDMETWVDDVDRNTNACSTQACAMGWAVLSGKFDGLHYRGKVETDPWDETGATVITGIRPYVNGRTSDFQTAAFKFFGNGVYHNIFLGSGDRAEVASGLREAAKQIRKGVELSKVNGGYDGFN